MCEARKEQRALPHQASAICAAAGTLEKFIQSIRTIRATNAAIMSRPPKDEAQNASMMTGSLDSSAPQAEPKTSKKRKRRTRAAPDGARDGAFIKKGAGQRIKFDNGDEVGGIEEPQEKEHVVPTKEVYVSATKEVPADVQVSKPANSNGVKANSDRSRPLKGPDGRQDPGSNGTRQTERRRPPVPASVPPHLQRRRDELLVTRKTLPIWPQAQFIRESLRRNNVLVLTGETGSGKSTQVPQFLLNEPWCTKTIAVTQPRRVAAISLARRVAEEMGSHFGGQNPAAKVGYSVRFDNSSGPGTRIKFLTEGMLLQEMLRDPDMNQYSAVIVDEVHERSVNVDLILGFLKNLTSGLEKNRRKRQVRTPQYRMRRNRRTWRDFAKAQRAEAPLA
jgi:ATP-dependent RNA helicase DHR2